MKLKAKKKAEDLDKKLRDHSLIETRQAKKMIYIEQYARENNVSIAQAMIHFM